MSLRPDPGLYGAPEGLAALKGYLGEKDLINPEILSFIEDGITAVSFNSDLDEVLTRAMNGYVYDVKSGTSFDKDKCISDLYTELKMHLAE